MIPSELYALFRLEVVDNDAPYFWSDEEIATYADAAQKMFCRLTGGIQDATSALASLTIVSGNPWVAYSPKILRIVSATLASTKSEVLVLNPPNLEEPGKAWSRSSIGLPGRVVALIAGLDDASLNIAQLPQANDTISLVIERLPANTLTKNSLVFEIPEQHHFYLLYWMKHLAYMKQDSQTFDKVKAAEEKANFEAYCSQAKLEKELRKNKPRLMAYGGIGGVVASCRW